MEGCGMGKQGKHQQRKNWAYWCALGSCENYTWYPPEPQRSRSPLLLKHCCTQTSAQITKTRNTRAEVQIVPSHPLCLEIWELLWHPITSCPMGPLVTAVSLQGNSHGGKQVVKPASLHENRSVLGVPESLAVAVAPKGIDFIHKWTWRPGNDRTLLPSSLRHRKPCPENEQNQGGYAVESLVLNSMAKTEGVIIVLKANTKTLLRAK